MRTRIERSSVRSSHTREQLLVYTGARCAACDRPIEDRARALEGRFPIVTPDRTLHVHARICTECLGDPELADPSGVQTLALHLVRRIGVWYAGVRTGGATAGLPADFATCSDNPRPDRS